MFAVFGDSQSFEIAFAIERSQRLVVIAIRSPWGAEWGPCDLGRNWRIYGLTR